MVANSSICPIIIFVRMLSPYLFPLLYALIFLVPIIMELFYLNFVTVFIVLTVTISSITPFWSLTLHLLYLLSFFISLFTTICCSSLEHYTLFLKSPKYRLTMQTSSLFSSLYLLYCSNKYISGCSNLLKYPNPWPSLLTVVLIS